MMLASRPTPQRVLPPTRASTYAAARAKERPLLNRDIQRLLEPLRITENVLLKNNLREVLFRKPAAAQTPAAPSPGH